MVTWSFGGEVIRELLGQGLRTGTGARARASWVDAWGMAGALTAGESGNEVINYPGKPCPHQPANGRVQG